MPCFHGAYYTIIDAQAYTASKQNSRILKTSPDCLDGIIRDGLIARHEDKAFVLSLGNQKTIERIAMDVRKILFRRSIADARIGRIEIS